jgi:lipopolysaccharide export system permease protein
MLSQFMVLFGFFALVLVSIFWINKAVRMFDRLIGDGQPAWVFLEFTALTLPGVIGVVLPMATFAATVYVTNRLSTESELTVMQATGYSPWRLMRPVIVFGVLIALMMSLLTHFLIPSSLSQLRLRQDEVSQNVTAKLLTEGEFLHPAPGITFYIRDITPDGELLNVFLSDRRDSENTMTYTSNRAYLIQEPGGGTKLLMVDGLAQNVRRDGNRLFTTHFTDFSYDISTLIASEATSLDKVTFADTRDMIRDPQAVAERTLSLVSQVIYELNNRFSQPLLCIVAAMIGFATLLLGGFSRFGVWRQILLAFTLLVLVKLVESRVSGLVLAHADLWPLMYLPALLGALITGCLLYIAARPAFGRNLLDRFRRRPLPEPEDGAA